MGRSHRHIPRWRQWCCSPLFISAYDFIHPQSWFSRISRCSRSAGKMNISKKGTTCACIYIYIYIYMYTSIYTLQGFLGFLGLPEKSGMISYEQTKENHETLCIMFRTFGTAQTLHIHVRLFNCLWSAYKISIHISPADLENSKNRTHVCVRVYMYIYICVYI